MRPELFATTLPPLEDLLLAKRVVPLALLALLTQAPCRDGSPPRVEVSNASPDVQRLLRLTQLDRVYGPAAGEGD